MRWLEALSRYALAAAEALIDVNDPGLPLARSLPAPEGFTYCPADRAAGWSVHSFTRAAAAGIAWNSKSLSSNQSSVRWWRFRHDTARRAAGGSIRGGEAILAFRNARGGRTAPPALGGIPGSFLPFVASRTSFSMSGPSPTPPRTCESRPRGLAAHSG